MQTKERNATFCILSVIGMILILLGHLDFPILTGGDLFPYYSYHVMIFPFISGYFYRPEQETHILSYVKHKCKTLLLPYFIFNLFYGMLATLLHLAGFSIGGNISLYNLFIAPFMGGHQFLYNAPAWFVPALFLLEVCNVIGRKILSYLRIHNEVLIQLLYLAIGCAAVFLSKRGSVYDFYKLPGRIMFLAPCFQFGRLYKTVLEKRDIAPNCLYFPILLLIQLFLVTTNAGLNFSAVWVSSFANSPLTPYLTTVTGIALWLRIAKILTPVLGKSRFVQYFGKNTYSVMMHHLFSFFIINSIFYAVSSLTAFFTDFDRAAFLSDIYYVYLPGGFTQFKWVYLMAGIFLPLGFCYAVEKIKGYYKNNRNGVNYVDC